MLFTIPPCSLRLRVRSFLKIVPIDHTTPGQTFSKGKNLHIYMAPDNARAA